MAEALAYEKADKHGNIIRCYMAPTVGPSWKPCQAKKQHINTIEVVLSDEDNHDYQDTEPAESKSTSLPESDCQDTLPSNAEKSFLIPCSLSFSF